MSPSLKASWAGLDKLLSRITRIERRLKSPGALKRALGRLLVDQTKHRIEVEKTSPDGRPWALWSEKYARTRNSGHSLLIDSRDMLESIKATVRADVVAVTTGVPYGNRQNSSRPFIGISAENRQDIEQLVQDWLERATR